MLCRLRYAIHDSTSPSLPRRARSQRSPILYAPPYLYPMKYGRQIRNGHAEERSRTGMNTSISHAKPDYSRCYCIRNTSLLCLPAFFERVDGGNLQESWMSLRVGSVLIRFLTIQLSLFFVYMFAFHHHILSSSHPISFLFCICVYIHFASFHLHPNHSHALVVFLIAHPGGSCLHSILLFSPLSRRDLCSSFVVVVCPLQVFLL